MIEWSNQRFDLSDHTLLDITLFVCAVLPQCAFFYLIQIQSSEGITISKDGTFHRLKIHKVTEEFAGKYKFEADGRKTEADIVVEGRNNNYFLAHVICTVH